MLYVDVIDNGKGLPVENRNRIFEPYMTMREKGTGLGLAIVKKIIDEHGGVIDLVSEKDKGAVFSIRLPKKNMPDSSA